MAQYRKKPVVIEAFQWVGPRSIVPDWAVPCGVKFMEDGTLIVPTLEGTMFADQGDYIIKGVAGEVYPCKPGIFNATYEPV